jgi:hypothetical protein
MASQLTREVDHLDVKSIDPRGGSFRVRVQMTREVDHLDKKVGDQGQGFQGHQGPDNSIQAGE